MPGLIAYTGSMPGKLKADRNRLDMVLSDEDKYILSFLESQTGASRTGAVRLALREAFASRGGTIAAMKESLAKAKEEAAE
jgi:hypothetical protein